MLWENVRRAQLCGAFSKFLTFLISTINDILPCESSIASLLNCTVMIKRQLQIKAGWIFGMILQTEFCEDQSDLRSSLRWRNVWVNKTAKVLSRCKWICVKLSNSFIWSPAFQPIGYLANILLDEMSSLYEIAFESQNQNLLNDLQKNFQSL